MNETVLDQLAVMMSMMGGEFPPKVAALLNGELVDYTMGQSMRMRFALDEKFNNPFGITFGGMYAMYFDMVMGPFSGIEAGAPTTSLDLNVSFLKSIRPADECIEVEVRLVNKTRQFLMLSGSAFKMDGTLVATSTSRMFILHQK